MIAVLAADDVRLVARITRRSAARLGLAPGRRLFAVIKSVAIDRRSLGLPPDDGRPNRV